jgi:hypothetical protein
MNWQEILISVVTVVLTGLATWAVTALTGWLNEKLKDKKSQRYAFAILEVVTSCVKATYQTYVEAIKGTDMWTKEAQEKALKMALESAKAQLDDELKGYITENFGGVDQYIIGLIEAILYDLKK